MLITLLGTLAAFLAFLLTLIFGRGQKRFKPVQSSAATLATTATTSDSDNSNTATNRKNPQLCYTETLEGHTNRTPS